jgi:hypothetical protein
MGKPKGKIKEQFTPEELELLAQVLDKEPEIADVAVSDINIDYSYQTRIRDRIRQQIKTNLKPALLQTGKLSRRPDGSLWAIDCATRVLGIKDRGEMNRKLHCEIFTTPGQQVEALLFDFFHDRRSYEPMKLETRLKAQSVAGLDHGFVEAIERLGFSLHDRHRNKIRGATDMVKAWELDHDGTAMTKAIFSIKDSWRDNYKLEGYMALPGCITRSTIGRLMIKSVARCVVSVPPT